MTHSEYRIVVEASGSILNDTYEGLVDAFSGSLPWEWDNRFGGVLAAFAVEDQDRVLAIIKARLAQVWDSASISDAPGPVSGAIQTFGGLNPGQLLFASDLNKDAILLGLWWPWGNGTTISIRFIPYALDSSDDEKKGIQAAMKVCFGL